jgi:NitT/TauT family transport system ATP-binding protein
MATEPGARQSSATEPKISFAGVQKRYPGKGGHAGTLALDSFDFDLAPAEVVSIVGPTGCGKSTALNVLAGFEMPSSGSVSVDGKVVTAPGSDRGVVFQQPSLFPWLTLPLLVDRGRPRGSVPARDAGTV